MRIPPKPPAKPTTVPPAPSLEQKVEQAAHSIFEGIGRAVHHAKEELSAFLHHRRGGAEELPVKGQGSLPAADAQASIASLNASLATIPSALGKNHDLVRAGAMTASGQGLSLSPSAQAEVGKLSPPFAQMFATTAQEVGKVARGELSPSGYLIAVMQDAQKLTDAYLGDAKVTPAQRNEVFARLVHFAFCAHAEDDSGKKLGSEDLKREAIGFGISDAGSLLEDSYRIAVASRYSTPSTDPAHPDVFGNGVKGGFNFNVQDRVSGESTITHHFGEFLGAGFVDMVGQADRAVTVVDSPGENPADVRNGYFAVMLGQGLASGALTPDRAISLARWALTDDGTTPPWGAPSPGTDSGQFLSSRDFSLDAWQRAYDAVH